MESQKETNNDKERDILYSQSIKAGHRMYYLDVKKNRREELYISITESKKKIDESQDLQQVSYEKHKIFIYKEDFQKFVDCFQHVVDFIEKEQGEAEPRAENNDIQIDMDF